MPKKIKPLKVWMVQQNEQYEDGWIIGLYSRKKEAKYVADKKRVAWRKELGKKNIMSWDVKEYLVQTMADIMFKEING